MRLLKSHYSYRRVTCSFALTYSRTHTQTLLHFILHDQYIDRARDGFRTRRLCAHNFSPFSLIRASTNTCLRRWLQAPSPRSKRPYNVIPRIFSSFVTIAFVRSSLRESHLLVVLPSLHQINSLVQFINLRNTTENTFESRYTIPRNYGLRKRDLGTINRDGHWRVRAINDSRVN